MWGAIALVVVAFLVIAVVCTYALERHHEKQVVALFAKLARIEKLLGATSEIRKGPA